MLLERSFTGTVGLMLSAAIPLVGQTRSVYGVAVDSSSGKPLSAVVAYANREPASARTGKDGKFAIAAEPLEPFFVVRLPGYVPARVSWTSADSAGNVGTVLLRKVKEDTDRFAVQAEDLRVYPQLAPFYERKLGSRQGSFLTPDDLQLSKTARLSDMIRRTPGMQKMCLVNSQGQLDCGRSGNRGPTTIMNQPAEEQTCPTAVWYYGRTGPAHASLDEVRMDEVIAIEGYERPGSTPPQFSGGQCGVIVLWMKPLDN